MTKQDYDNYFDKTSDLFGPDFLNGYKANLESRIKANHMPWMNPHWQEILDALKEYLESRRKQFDSANPCSTGASRAPIQP